MLAELGVQVGTWNEAASRFEGCVINDAAFDNLDQQWHAFYWGPECQPQQLQESAIAQAELTDVGQVMDALLDEMMGEHTPWTVEAVQATLADGNSITLKCSDLRLELSRNEADGYHYFLDAGAGGGCTFGDCPNWDALATELDGWLLNNPPVTGLSYEGGLTEVLTIAVVDIQESQAAIAPVEQPSVLDDVGIALDRELGLDNLPPLSQQPTAALVNQWSAGARNGSVEHQALLLAHIRLGSEGMHIGTAYDLVRSVDGGIAIYASGEMDAPLLRGHGDGSIDSALDGQQRQHFQQGYQSVAQMFQQSTIPPVNQTKSRDGGRD